MAGLGEILEENLRLRESLAVLEAALKANEAALEAEAVEHQITSGKLDVATKRIDQLEKAMAWIEHGQIAPASERYVSDAQRQLPFVTDLTPPPRDPVAEAEDQAEKKTSRRRAKRRKREDFEHMDDRKVECKASSDATCAGCGGPLKTIGTAKSFRVEWVPGKFIVEDVLRDKCSCPKCPGEGVLTVPGPYALERALCGNALLARVLVDKFADHLPVHRQAKRMGRKGFKVGSNTLSRWVLLAAKLLRPLYRAIRKELLAGEYLQGDDTGFPVQDAGNGALRKGRFWAFTDQEHVFYAFTATKEGEHPAELLKTFGGDLLLVDGGSEFNRVVRELGLKRAGCWSHLRKYFFQALLHHPDEARLALNTIQDLFLIERQLRGQPADVVEEQRRRHAQPLVDGLFRWAKALSTVSRPKSKLGEALTYAINQEATMRLFLQHGELPIHNNLSELMLRQAVVGRKNWLFARSEGGAIAAATMYTLVGSCMLQGIDPQAYLVDILNRLPDYPSNKVHELTPKAWEARK